MSLLLFFIQWTLYIGLSSTILFYVYCKFYIFKYWEKKGVWQLNPVFPLGDLHLLLKRKLGIIKLFNCLYHENKKHRYLGIYNFTRPCLLVNDPQLVKTILVRDSSYFPDRGTYSNPKFDPLSGGLIQMSGDKWKNMRMNLTPAFTSGKIKGMLPTLQKFADRLKRYMEKSSKNEGEIEVRDLLARYATDIIASLVFGEEIDSIGNPNQIFREKGRKVFDLSIKNAFRFISMLLAPKILSLLKMKFVDQDVEDFFITMLDTNIEERIRNNKFHKDFLQLLLQLRNTGSIKLNDDWDAGSNEAKSMTLPELTAQAFTLYSAGFETTSSTMSFCIYQLAKNQHILAKVQQEIDCILNLYDGVLSYEAYQEMSYLENCIDETLRIYPPLPILQRVATRKYKLPDSDLVIEPGTLIICPIIGIQTDPDLHSDPMKFIPERFTDPKYADTLKTAYYPFGDGPRLCIGMRLGKLIAEVGLASILSQYHFELGHQHENKELEFNKKAVLLAPESGINLKVKPRTSTYN